MNTKRWTLFMCALVTLMTLHGQSDSRQVAVIQPGQHSAKVNFDNFLEVDIEVSYNDEQDGANLSLKFTNLGYGNDYAHDLVVFDRPYYKSDLDDKKPKYVLKKGIYKAFNAKNSSERVLPLSIEGQRQQVSNDIMILRSGMDGEHVDNVFSLYDEPLVLEIPAYVVAKASNKKVEIISHVVCTLDLTVKRPKPKRDPVLENLRDEYRDVADRIDKAVFCHGKKHKPTLKEQKKPYLKELEDLDEKIAQAQPSVGNGTKSYQAYQELRFQVDSLTQWLEKTQGKLCASCSGKKSVTSHSCQYCNTNIEQQLMMLASKAKRGEQLTTAEQNQAKALYNCAVARKAATKSIKSYYQTIMSGKAGNTGSHHCQYCNTNIEKQLMLLATKANRGTTLSAAEKAKAKGLYECAKARGKVNSSITNYYNRIMK